MEAATFTPEKQFRSPAISSLDHASYLLYDKCMHTTAKNIIVAIVFFFLALFAYSKIAGPITFSVNNIDTQNSPFTSTGTGEVKGTPSQATVSLGVTATSSSSDQARSSANNVINKVTADLKSLGIDESEIKTSNFSVTPNRQGSIQPLIAQPSSETGANGYTANVTIEVNAPSVELANQAIDIASKDGANVIGGVSFTFDEKEQAAMKQKALKLAVADAKLKAQNLANAAGIKLGRVINISEDGNGGPMPLMAKEGSAASDSTQLSPGENTVSVTVTLTYEVN
jgi:uncharacterized protein YggE